MERALDRLKRKGYRIVLVDASTSTTVDELVRAIAAEVPEWPDRYVPNLDAFEDALFDMDFPAEAGIAIALVGFDEFEQRCLRAARAVLNIIESRS